MAGGNLPDIPRTMRQQRTDQLAICGHIFA